MHCVMITQCFVNFKNYCTGLNHSVFYIMWKDIKTLCPSSAYSTFLRLCNYWVSKFFDETKPRSHQSPTPPNSTWLSTLSNQQQSYLPKTTAYSTPPSISTAILYPLHRKIQLGTTHATPSSVASCQTHINRFTPTEWRTISNGCQYKATTEPA